MHKLAIVCLAFILSVSSADARPRHHAKSMAYDRSNALHSSGRPADCYGIRWCGCWLRHQFGFPASSGLNLARNWRRFPAASPETANIVVWPGGTHVGRVLGCNGNTCTVISGNAGRNQIRTREIKATRGFRFGRV